MNKPRIKSDPLYQLLRQEDIKSFNEQRDNLDTSQLRSGDYRGRDLRNMNASGLDFSDSYFRNADLSGIDFRSTNLEGASLLDAKLSGTYFPAELPAQEIRLSLDTGTRLRYRSD
jgi:uncharacterized protein YjbI with pentapeptide repeats